MAFYNETLTRGGWFAGFSGIATRFGDWMARMMEAQSRVDVVRRLENCSDAELSRLGIKREDIVRHVYRDIYFL